MDILKREKPWRPGDPERSPNFDFGYSQERWILTTWGDEHLPGEEWGWKGTPQTVLRELTDPIWHDRLIRLGHARSYERKLPLGESPAFWYASHNEPRYVVDSIEPGWEHYRVFLRDRDGVDGEAGRELDLDATVAENGLTQRQTYVRFEKGDG